MTLTNFFILISFSISMLGLTLYRRHLVSALLCIEAMLLSLFISITTISQTLLVTNTIIHPIILLTMSVCEGSAGLALLVATIRTHSSDHLNTLNLLKC
uniref:NADH-ubiquinone oxidoreductase chain 4L n=1 Tax=Phelsuma laticauda TaxID=143529 RepID=K9JWV6_9SAUR|nr:NADH dehydrogenase subunit 4L [Phelsuma laticauda]